MIFYNDIDQLLVKIVITGTIYLCATDIKHNQIYFNLARIKPLQM